MEERMGSLIEKEAVVLFQGDSITDAGRNRENGFDLGFGYAAMAASWFSALQPEKRVLFLNRGVGGNTVKELRARWQRDCLDLKPTWVSIMVGINDTGRRYMSNQYTPPEEFESVYREILSQVRDKLGARLVLCEPFLLPIPEDRIPWRVDLDPKIQVVRKLAREFGAILVPFDGLFAGASARRELAFWSDDGVHPSLPGHALMAQEWLRAVQLG
jgi:lysophospholipase L1-like esterase